MINEMVFNMMDILHSLPIDNAIRFAF